MSWSGEIAALRCRVWLPGEPRVLEGLLRGGEWGEYCESRRGRALFRWDWLSGGPKSLVALVTVEVRT